MVVPRHSYLFDGVAPSDSRQAGWNTGGVRNNNPLTGNGFAAGSKGLPEFHTGVPSQMREGAEMWQLRADGTQRLEAVLKQTDVDADADPILTWERVM